jgi:ParB/RepB/Spo0J family partition protein
MKIKVAEIIPNPRQPRTRFERKKMAELEMTMGNPAVGQLHPILVEPGADEYLGKYIIIDGERRWRTAVKLGWDVIDANIREATNHNGQDRLIHAFVSNEQRADFNAMERARGYKAMLDELGSVDEIHARVGKSVSTIYSHLALLEFEAEVQALFERGAIVMSPGVIAALKRLDKERRIIVATRAATRGATEAVFLQLCKRQENAKLPLRRLRKAAESAPVEKGKHFNALNLAPGRFLPEIVVKPAELTCQACDLYDMASGNTCRQCPLVDFLRRL